MVPPTEANQDEQPSSSEELSERVVTLRDPSGAPSEAYRSIRTNLLYSLTGASPKVIVITSPGPQEGKSTTCANLAITLTQAGKKILLLDCDLRKPVIHETFGIKNLRGVVNVLVGENSLEQVWQEPLQGLKVVTVGPVPPNPAELLGSQGFNELIERGRQNFDYVLVDASPVEAVADPIVLATHSDGVLLVLDAQKTRKAAARRSVHSIEAVGANLLGSVLNNFKAHKEGYYGYGRYGYGYG